MNSSKLIKQIYSYSGFRSVERTAETDAEIARCLDELKIAAHFRYIYKFFDSPPAFLLKEPYLSYLGASRGVILSVMTLGGEVDLKIRFYERTDAAKAVVFDACASAYLEYLSDGYERTIGNDLSYRFCPGYGGSDVSDIKYIFEILKPEKIGVTLSRTDYMLPSKSMTGVIAVGGRTQKTCKSCTVAAHCAYKKGGVKCYDPENK